MTFRSIRSRDAARVKCMGMAKGERERGMCP
jgi:hypothetical protein